MNTNLIRQALEQLPLPYLITDRDFNIQWYNSSLKKQYAYLSIMCSLEGMLFGYDPEAILRQLNESDAPLTLACKLPMTSVTLTLAPLREDSVQEVEAIVVTLTGTASLSESSNAPLTAFHQALRAPVSGLFGSISLLQRRLQDDFAPELLDMNRDCYRMLRACISISEYSEYINGQSAPQFQYYDLGRFLREQLEPAVPLLEKIGMELTLDLPQESIPCAIDSEKLALVLFSLLSNSCTFCDSRNQIHISLNRSETHATITLSDQGYGIPLSILPRVMEPYFSRGLDDLDRPGIGLGLPLSKAIMEQHGGTLALQSVQDKGTTVALSLPLNRVLPYQDLQLRSSARTYGRDLYSKRNIFLSPVLLPEDLL
ncbi:MAG: HAMP domain-containing histidine kinase [Oscillospiraceae bacterium]|nr:HAMP domain-containing histidine kinase [Oscillospiraceae bacterium]